MATAPSASGRRGGLNVVYRHKLEAILFLNDTFNRVETSATRELALEQGWALHEQVLRGAFAGE